MTEETRAAGRPYVDPRGPVVPRSYGLCPEDVAWVKEQAWRQRTNSSAVVREAVARLRSEIEGQS